MPFIIHLQLVGVLLHTHLVGWDPTQKKMPSGLRRGPSLSNPLAPGRRHGALVLEFFYLTSSLRLGLQPAAKELWLLWRVCRPMEAEDGAGLPPFPGRPPGDTIRAAIQDALCRPPLGSSGFSSCKPAGPFKLAREQAAPSHVQRLRMWADSLPPLGEEKKRREAREAGDDLSWGFYRASRCASTTWPTVLAARSSAWRHLCKQKKAEATSLVGPSSGTCTTVQVSHVPQSLASALHCVAPHCRHVAPCRQPVLCRCPCRAAVLYTCRAACVLTHAHLRLSLKYAPRFVLLLEPWFRL